MREYRELQKRHTLVLDAFADQFVRYIRLDEDYRDVVERNEDLLQQKAKQARSIAAKPTKARDVQIH